MMGINGSHSHRCVEGISSSSHPRRASFNSSYISSYDYSASIKLKQPSLTDLQRLRAEGHRLHKLRDKLYRSRLMLKELRNELRDERENINELEAKLMTALRQIRHIGDLKTTAFETSYQELEERRDVFGSLQYDYDKAEEGHEVMEEQLEQQEDILQRLLSKITAQMGDANVDVDLPSVSTSPLSETFPSHEITQNPSSWPAEELYQSRLGDARIVRERLQEIWFEMKNKSRRNATVAMIHATDVDDTESMKEIKLALSKTKAQLEIIEKDIESLSRERPAEELYQFRLGDTREGLEEVSSEMKDKIERRATMAMIHTTDTDDAEPIKEKKLAYPKTGAEVQLIKKSIESLSRETKRDIHHPLRTNFRGGFPSKSLRHVKSDIASALPSHYCNNVRSKILQLKLQGKWIPSRSQDALRSGSTTENPSVVDARSSSEISWAHFLLRKSDEVDIASYSDSGEAIRYQLMSVHPSPSSTALRAVRDYYLQFPSIASRPRAQSEISLSEYDRRLSLEDSSCDV